MIRQGIIPASVGIADECNRINTFVERLDHRIGVSDDGVTVIASPSLQHIASASIVVVQAPR